MKKTIGTALLVATAALLLTACGSSSGTVTGKGISKLPSSTQSSSAPKSSPASSSSAPSSAVPTGPGGSTQAGPTYVGPDYSFTAPVGFVAGSALDRGKTDVLYRTNDYQDSLNLVGLPETPNQGSITGSKLLGEVLAEVKSKGNTKITHRVDSLGGEPALVVSSATSPTNGVTSEIQLLVLHEKKDYVLTIGTPTLAGSNEVLATVKASWKWNH